MNPNDFGNTDQASLLQAIQNYAAMLAQQKQANDEMGVNPQIIQGQSNVDQARVQAAQGLLDAPAVAPGQNWEVDPNGANNVMAQKLMSQGPPAMVAPRQQASYGNPLMDMLRPTDWETAGFNKNVRAQYDRDLARARNNSETRMLTPQEMQARDIAMKQAPLDAATGLLGATKPQQAFDPAMLQAGLKPIEGVATGAQKSRDQFVASEGLVRAADVTGKANIAAAKVKAAGDLEVEKAKAGTKDAELAKSTKGALEMQVIDAEAMQTTLQTLGKDFDVDYFNDISLAKNDIAQWASRKGIDMSQAQEEYTRGRTQFILNVKQMFNAYRKSITGAAASEKELADLETSIFNTKMSPPAAKAALLDLMTNVQLKAFIARNALENGVLPKGIKPRSKEFGDYIDSVAQAGDYSKIKEGIRAYYLQQNPALNPNPVPARPAGQRVDSPEDIAKMQAKLQAIRQAKQQQPAQGQQPQIQAATQGPMQAISPEALGSLKARLLAMEGQAQTQSAPQSQAPMQAVSPEELANLRARLMAIGG